jgi:hypothetical protein
MAVLFDDKTNVSDIFRLACEHGSVCCVKALIQRVNLLDRNEFKKTFLGVCKSGYIVILRLLLDHGFVAESSDLVSILSFTHNIRSYE